MSGMEELALTKKLQSMLELQDAINCKIRLDWRNANNAWFRAIWTECAELVDHFGWKWWKRQTPDLPQVHLELVDIFHFGLSELLQEHGSALEVVGKLIKTYCAYGARPVSDIQESDDCIAFVEAFANSVLTTKRFDLQQFCALASSVGLSEEKLYELYIGKNVLNGFRQDHGYKSGEYIKTWDGREDNVWLVELSAALGKHPDSFAIELYQRLSKKYAEVALAR